MSQITVRGQVDATYATQVQAAVAKYAADNPSVSVADKVVLQLVGADGQPCQVEGAFQRGKYGQIVFTVIGLIGAVKKVVQAVKKALGKDRPHSPSAKRAARRESKGNGRSAGLQAIYSGSLPADPEKRLEFFLKHELARKEGQAYVIAGGKRFASRKAVLEHLAAQVSDDAAPVPAAPAPAPTKVAAPAKKAVKKAVKKAAKAAKKAVKKEAQVAKKAAKAKK